MSARQRGSIACYARRRPDIQYDPVGGNFESFRRKMKFAHHSRPIYAFLGRLPAFSVGVPAALLAHALSAVGCTCPCKNAGQPPAVSAVNTAASDGSPAGEAGPFARE